MHVWTYLPNIYKVLLNWIICFYNVSPSYLSMVMSQNSQGHKMAYQYNSPSVDIRKQNNTRKRMFVSPLKTCNTSCHSLSLPRKKKRAAHLNELGGTCRPQENSQAASSSGNYINHYKKFSQSSKQYQYLFCSFSNLNSQTNKWTLGKKIKKNEEYKNNSLLVSLPIINKETQTILLMSGKWKNRPDSKTIKAPVSLFLTHFSLRFRIPQTQTTLQFHIYQTKREGIKKKKKFQPNKKSKSIIILKFLKWIC